MSNNTATAREFLCEAIQHLAQTAGRDGQHCVASVLYTLAGAMTEDREKELAKITVEFSRRASGWSPANRPSVRHDQPKDLKTVAERFYETSIGSRLAGAYSDDDVMDAIVRELVVLLTTQTRQ